MELSPSIRSALIVLGTNAIVVAIAGLALMNCCFSNSCPHPNPFPGLVCGVAIVGFAGISLVQLVYVLPFMIWLFRRQQFESLKGTITAGILTALLNGGCFILLLVR